MKRRPISKVWSLAFVMPAYDLTDADEYIPTWEIPVCYFVYEWRHESQSWVRASGMIGTEVEAREIARQRHEYLKTLLKIDLD